MKLLLQLVTSILLTSVCVAGWPYREIVNIEQSALPVFVAPVYDVAPAVSSPDSDEELATVVAGPITGTTFVEGSSSGPVTVLSPLNAADVLRNNPTLTKNATEVVVPNVTEDSVLIKGASSGPVTLIAPSAAIADDAAETKEGIVASPASVAIENTAEGAAKASAMTISETIGVASAKAVIGPSTGPIIIAGPTAPPVPTTAAVPTVAPLTVADTAEPVGPASASIASNLAATETVEEHNNETTSVPDATEPSRAEVSASNSATRSSGNSTVSTSAKVNLITPAAIIAAAETATSSIVVSAVTVPAAHASGPSGTISEAAASTLHPLP
nr:calphotin-like [Megalopta genalis]